MTPRLAESLAEFFTHAGRLLFPPYCIGCGRISDELFCAECAAQLPRVLPPICPRCGKPLHTSVPRVNCGHCSSHDWTIKAARALFKYEGAGREAMHRLKYGGRRGLARFFGNALAQEAGNANALAGLFGWELGEEAQLVVPVPLHPRKRFQRGFNQNELVLRFYAPVLGLPVAAGALARKKLTRPQVRLTEAQRFDNVRGAFAVLPRMRAEVEGRRVLLLDDVITTGATINAAARALKKAGAERVYALALFTSAPD
jgi:ComF family protein